MCDKNCCKPKEDDLICAMPLCFCHQDHCCPLPCGGCFKDEGCDCCCDCDDSCCYCKYYKMLRELQDQLKADEDKIRSLESTDRQHETKIENYYQNLLKKLEQLIGTDQDGVNSLYEMIQKEIYDRVRDVNDEESRATTEEKELLRLIRELEQKEIKDDADQKAYIDEWVQFLLNNTDIDLNSFFEVLQRLEGDESNAWTLLQKINQEIENRIAEDNGLKERVTTLETTVADTTDKGIDLQFGHAGDNNRDVIATVNGVDITVGLPNIPAMKDLTFTGTTNVIYNGSQAQTVAIPTHVNQIGGGDAVIRIDAEDNNGDLVEYEKINGSVEYFTVPYAKRSTDAVNAVNADLKVVSRSQTNGDTINIGDGAAVTILNAKHADNATKDGNGDNIASTYLKKADGVTGVDIDSNNYITYTIDGQTYTVSKQPYLTSVKTINTTNATAQTTDAAEAIDGTGTINLHKVSKTGDFGDLLNVPTDHVNFSSNQTITGAKTFKGVDRIILQGNNASDKPGFAINNSSGAKMGFLEYRGGDNLMVLGVDNSTQKGNNNLKVGFRDFGSYSYNATIPKGSDKNGTFGSGDVVIPIAVNGTKAGNDGNISITIPAAPVQSDWNETGTSSLAYINNKPTVPSKVRVGSGGSEYTVDSNGVIEIPAYPTIPTVPDITGKADKTDAIGNVTFDRTTGDLKFYSISSPNANPIVTINLLWKEVSNDLTYTSNSSKSVTAGGFYDNTVSAS